MILTREKSYGNYHIIEIEGRIDGLTSSALGNTFEKAAEDGLHNLVVDFSSVSYISSAGLRVFLHLQKKLKPVGGEVILMSVQDNALDVFRVSGLDKLFRIISGLRELGKRENGFVKENTESGGSTKTEEGFSWESRDVPSGRYSGIGNASKLKPANFSEQDIITRPQSELKFAAGLATIGESVKDYHSLFGESVLINHHFFGYPAVEQPAVDFSWYSAAHPGPVHLLYGFSFDGDYSLRLRFDPAGPVDLMNLARRAAEISGRDFFGMVMVGKSAGIYGMNLKRIPWQENRPDPPDIMHDANFADWFDFPVEDTDMHKTVVAAGIYSKMEKEEELHMHGVVFQKGLIGKSGIDVDAEIQRIFQGSEPLKVMHLLEESRFYYGLAGIISL